MSSLIFWAPYLTHKAIVGHKREKKRQKNYERWEGLRDEYDDMKRVTTQRQSLDYQPTGPQFYPGDDSSSPSQPRHSLSSDRDLFTLRDQQEAGDARTAWTPQERWQQRPTPAGMSSASVERLHPQYTAAQPPQHTSQAGPLQRQKTGATWDEGLPPPMRVSRRQWADNGNSMEEASLSTNSSRQDITRVSSGRRSGSLNREEEEKEERRRKNEEVHVVESPYEWWK
jgi:hypothetical protein